MLVEPSVLERISGSSQTIWPLKNGILGWMVPCDELSQIWRALESEMMYSKVMDRFSHQSPIDWLFLTNERHSLVVRKTSRVTIGSSSEVIMLRGHRMMVDFKPVWLEL